MTSSAGAAAVDTVTDTNGDVAVVIINTHCCCNYDLPGHFLRCCSCPRITAPTVVQSPLLCNKFSYRTATTPATIHITSAKPLKRIKRQQHKYTTFAASVHDCTVSKDKQTARH